MKETQYFTEYASGIAPNVEGALDAVKKHQEESGQMTSGQRGLPYFEMESLGDHQGILWRVPSSMQHYSNGKRSRTAR
ncbi:MAG TPA: hypothetical protein VN711_00575 [Candidatus Saccharimonadales bacterium]|nr:hypothetical protein [Candidatus Saccharimonadales bacterium]